MMKHMPDTFKAVYPKDAKCKKNVQNDNTVFAHFVTLCVCVGVHLLTVSSHGRMSS